MEINPSDLSVSRYDADRHAGGWTLNRKFGITVTHKPSGLSASSESDRSEHRNRAMAMEALQKLVDEWDAAGRPTDSNLRMTKAEWDAEAAQVHAAISYAPVPNPNKVDFAQMRKDMNNGVLLCRSGILNAIDFGIELQAKNQTTYLAQGDGYVSLVAEPVDPNCKVHDDCSATSIADPDEGGKRVASINTDAKE